MKIRTFVWIALGFCVLALVTIGFHRNADLLNTPFRVSETSQPPVFVIIIAAFAAGILVPISLGLPRWFEQIGTRMRRAREERRQTQVDERYYEGLQAIVEGRENDALRCFRSVLEMDPSNYNALLKMGEVLCAMGRYAEGIDYHLRARSLRPEDSRSLYALAADYEAQGNIAEAKAMLKRIASLKPHSVLVAVRRLRDISMREGDWAAALQAHNRVERTLHKSGRLGDDEKATGRGIRYSLGVKYMKDGKTRIAVNLFRRLIKEDPLFIPAYIRLGATLREMDDEREAAEVWNRGFEITGSPIFLTVLEEHYLDQEQPLAAIEALRHCVAAAKKDILPRFFLGKLYFRLEMLDEALATLEALRGRTSYAPTLHYLIGRIHERRGNFRSAALQYRNVIKELELVKLEYRCLSCAATLSEWLDRCPKCAEWNTVEIDFREDISLQDLGVATAPIYSQLT
jgi:lipopolysaccharide biosynthesis regulator YciM